jgi:ribosome-associated protein
MIDISSEISLDEKEIRMNFVRAAGPGGQNVNKVASAVQLRFDVAASKSLPGDVRRRLMKQEKSRINENGVLIIEARRFRTQQMNRRDAVQRLVKMIRKAATKPKRRKRTRRPLALKNRILDAKRRRGRLKRSRSGIRDVNE